MNKISNLPEPLYVGKECSPGCEYFQVHTERGSEITCSKYNKRLRAETWERKHGPVRLVVCQQEFK